MAPVRVLRGPPSDSYGKHTDMHVHYTQAHIIHGDISVYLSLWSWLRLHLGNFIPSDVPRSLRGRERAMPSQDGFAATVLIFFPEEVYFSV